MHDIQKAFTLVELLVVAIIIGILSSLALSTYSKHKENAIRSRIFAAAEGWNQEHSAYLARNLMPPSSRLSHIESPSEAAAEVFLILKPYIPSVREYATLSDFESSIAKDIGLENNPYKIIYAKKNDRIWQFMAVDKDAVETPNEADTPEVPPEIPPYNDYIPSIRDPIAQLPDINLHPIEEPTIPVTPPEEDETPQPEKKHTPVSLYAGAYTVDIYINPNNTELNEITKTIGFGINGSCELCPASNYIWSYENGAGPATISLSGAGNNAVATISFSALPDDSSTGSFSVYCKIGDGHPCEFGNSVYTIISYNVIIQDTSENEGGLNLDSEYKITCDMALMPPIEYSNILSDTYIQGDTVTSIWSGITSTEYEYARPLLRIKLTSENSDTPVKDNLSEFNTLMGKSIDLSWLDYTGKIEGKAYLKVSDELSKNTNKTFSINKSPVTYRSSSQRKEITITEVKYGEVVGLGENCIYILPSDPKGDNDVWSLGDYETYTADIPQWAVYTHRHNIDTSGYEPQIVNYVIVEGQNNIVPDAHHWWSTSTLNTISNTSLGSAEKFKLIRALNPYVYQFAFWGNAQFSIFSEDGVPSDFATQISGVGYDLGYAINYLTSYILGDENNYRGLTEEKAVELLNEYLTFIDTYFNGEVSRPYLITFYGNYKEEMTEEQITALKDKINNYIITHALY